MGILSRNQCLLSVLTEGEIEASRKRREHVGGFVRHCYRMIRHEPRDAKIVIHLEDRGKSNGVSWIKLDDHFKTNELAKMVFG